MGLDLSFYRVERGVAEQFLIPVGTKCKWGFTYQYTLFNRDDADVVFDAKEEITYQRKNYFLLASLGVLYPNPGQCDYIQVTKLQAYHLLYVMKNNNKYSDDVKDYRRFKESFEQALRNFDWENDYMFWSWC